MAGKMKALYKAELIAICAAVCILLIMQTTSLRAESRTRNENRVDNAFVGDAAPEEKDLLLAYTNEVRRLASDAGYEEDRIRMIAADLFSSGYGIENMSKLDPVHRNADGLTYGPDALGADLISCIADDGKPGFVYASEMNPETDGLVTLEQIERAASEDIVLNVYAADGKTVVGKFTLTVG